jgi:glycosyltransferase involved in cell wall biosynthesis
LPQARVVHLRLGHGTLVPPEEVPGRRARARARHGLPAEAIVFGCFGGLTPEKRIPQILDAFDTVLPYAPSARLLLAGPDAAHYDVAADVGRRGLDQRVVFAGYVETDDQLTDCIAASDVTLNLRWPTAREVSGPWLRSLAAGRASIVMDLSHTTDVPSFDPRTWIASAADGAAPVTVAIDIVDEDHSLRLAMRRLATDAALREAIGHAARNFWMRAHSQAVMLDDYRRILHDAAAAPLPAPTLPHTTADQSALLERLLGEFGVPVPWSKI